jgi:hypothetical protein
MEITGQKLIEMFYTSMTDDKMVEIIDELGLEQPIIDEDYELYKSVSTNDTNGIGIDFTFSELVECSKVGIPCMDVISWDNDKTIKPPFGLSLSFSYTDTCRILERKADYTSTLIDELRTWVIDDKYLINIDFKTIDLTEITGIVISPFTIDKLDDTYVKNKD